MNKIRKLYALIGFLLVCAIVLFGYIFVSERELRITDDSEYKLVYEEVFGVSNLERITIDLISFNLNIYESSDNLARIKVYDVQDKYIKRAISKDDYVFKEKERANILPSSVNTDAHVDFYIPIGYGNQLILSTINGNILNEATLVALLSVDTISGRVNLGDISSLNLAADSGSININRANKINIKTRDANIDVNECVIDKIETKSGHVNINKAMVESSGVIKTDTGSISITTLSNGYADVNSLRGKVNVLNEYEHSKNNLYINTVSGNVNINQRKKV